jgi:hypothetical protein
MNWDGVIGTATLWAFTGCVLHLSWQWGHLAGREKRTWWKWLLGLGFLAVPFLVFILQDDHRHLGSFLVAAVIYTHGFTRRMEWINV